MRGLSISIFLLALVLASSDMPSHAKGLSTGNDGHTLEDKSPEHLRYANEYKKKHRKSGGGGVGIGITIDPSILSKPRKRKKTVAPQKRPSTQKKERAQKRPSTQKKEPAQKRVTTTQPKPDIICPERAFDLIGDADYWREKADYADAEAAMAREAARGWRNISKQAAEAAEYAKKAGLTSSQTWHENFSATLEQRAEDYEASADKKENEASALRGMADEEDKDREKQKTAWCENYKKDTSTALSSETPAISLTSAEKAQADALFQDRVAAAEKEKKARDEAKEHDRKAEADPDGEYQEHDVMVLDKKLYTAKDMEEYVERWKTAPDQNDPVIQGAGHGLGRDIMMLAQWRPDLAAALLNKLSELKTDDLDGALRVVKLIRQQTRGSLKIATEFGKPAESWGKAGVDRAVERMETTLKRQIRKESKPALIPTIPASNTNGETPSTPPPTGGETTDIPVASTPVPNESCPERTFILKGDADYWREKADFTDAEAAMAREAAKRWRATSAKAKEDAETEKKSGSASSQKLYEDHPAKWEQRAKDYEASAEKKEKEARALRSKADAEDKDRAELEKERCKALEELPRNAFSPEPVEIRDEPKNPASSKLPTQPKNMCGPDITDNVFQVLDMIHRDWNGWNESKQNELCRDLLNPLTSEGAWDIKALSPNTAPPSKKKYLKTHTTLKNYEKDVQKRLYWFEEYTAACAKPRQPCGPTVTFLGQCIHTQVVNYIEWGVMNKLCDQEGLAKNAHRARAAVLSSDAHIYDGQKIMTGVGSAYTAATQSGKIFEGPILSSDPGELQGRHDNIISKMKEKLSELMAAPENAGFASRPAINCSLPCPMTTAEKAQLKRNTFGYEWGYGAKWGIGGR